MKHKILLSCAYIHKYVRFIEIETFSALTGLQIGRPLLSGEEAQTAILSAILKKKINQTKTE